MNLNNIDLLWCIRQGFVSFKEIVLALEVILRICLMIFMNMNAYDMRKGQNKHANKTKIKSKFNNLSKLVRIYLANFLHVF